MQNAGNYLSLTKENKVLHVLCTRLKAAFLGEISQKVQRVPQIQGLVPTSSWSKEAKQ